VGLSGAAHRRLADRTIRALRSSEQLLVRGVALSRRLCRRRAIKKKSVSERR